MDFGGKSQCGFGLIGHLAQSSPIVLANLAHPGWFLSLLEFTTLCVPENVFRGRREIQLCPWWDLNTVTRRQT
jgi:hypothetical protein